MKQLLLLALLVCAMNCNAREPLIKMYDKTGDVIPVRITEWRSRLDIDGIRGTATTVRFQNVCDITSIRPSRS